jgi:hypothetical protein
LIVRIAKLLAAQPVGGVDLVLSIAVDVHQRVPHDGGQLDVAAAQRGHDHGIRAPAPLLVVGAQQQHVGVAGGQKAVQRKSVLKVGQVDREGQPGHQHQRDPQNREDQRDAE